MSDIPNRIHKVLIEKIVRELADKPLVLKGGTALMLAYNLDRYSEDIDYDSNTKIDLIQHLEAIMQKTRMQYDITIKKHTNTTSRFFIRYETEKIRKTLLKIETKNNLRLSSNDFSNHPGFFVYSIDKICQNKLDASLERIKPRDLYDLGFIARHYKKELNDRNLNRLKELANNKTLHEPYRKEWNNDDFVKHKPFNSTIMALNSIQEEEGHDPWDWD